MQSSTGLYDFANSEDILVGGAELGSQAGGQDGWFASEASTPDLWGSVVGTPAAADSPSVRTEAPATSVGRGDPPPAAPVEMAQVADKVRSTALSSSPGVAEARADWAPPLTVVQDLQDSQGKLVVLGAGRLRRRC